MARGATRSRADEGRDVSPTRSAETPQSPQPVEHALETFYPLSQPWLRWVVANFWWIQLGLIALDAALFAWLGTPGLKLILILAPHVFVGIAAVLAYRSLERLRDHVLRRLWERGVIKTRAPRLDPMRPGSHQGRRLGLRSRPAMRSFAVDVIEEPVGHQYAAYVNRFHRRLNGWRAAVIVGSSFAFAFYSFYVALGYRWGFPVAGLARSPASKHLVRWLIVPDLLIQAGLAFVVGVVAWRLVVVAWELWHLAGDFDFELQLQHPDKSAGLGPLGDICFSVAAVWGVAAIYPTVWLFFLALGSVKGTGFFSLAHLSFKGEGALNCVTALQDKFPHVPVGCPTTLALAHTKLINAAHDVLHTLTFYVGGALILTFVFAILTFYVPLYFVHRGMERQRPQLFPLLDRLGRRIGELTRELGTMPTRPAAPAVATVEASGSNPSASTETSEGVATELAAVREAYEAGSAVPKWPFDAKVLGKFLGSTVIPLTGLTTWLPALIGKSFGA